MPEGAIELGCSVMELHQADYALDAPYNSR
jgi:hypothetical protein